MKATIPLPWTPYGRPGYFGRRRDEKIAGFNEQFGEGNWMLDWMFQGMYHSFASACKLHYEESYFQYLKDNKVEVDFICLFNEVMDNAETNVSSGLDYTKQEAFSTHIQDIAIRNVLHRLDRKFEGKAGRLLVIRSTDSEGFRFGPGNIPFMMPDEIIQPSLRPGWADEGSVEDYWQSNKVLRARLPG